jgi:hypothetical protein
MSNRPSDGKLLNKRVVGIMINVASSESRSLNTVNGKDNVMVLLPTVSDAAFLPNQLSTLAHSMSNVFRVTDCINASASGIDSKLFSSGSSQPVGLDGNNNTPSSCDMTRLTQSTKVIPTETGVAQESPPPTLSLIVTRVLAFADDNAFDNSFLCDAVRLAPNPELRSARTAAII